MAKPRKQPHAQQIGVAEFKARCLELLDKVDTRGDQLVITRRGKPIATVSPVRPELKSLKGLLAGKMAFSGDIVGIDWTDEWKATR